MTRWRMMLAANRLANEGMTISLVAPTVGYESKSAFGAAFKRAFGYSPKQYAKGAGR
nr:MULTISPECIES: AraC family transcriptional regulator [unclassified Rhizobium]